ncbi:hypothetical protein RJ641_035395, partial [Dillenia turbinata]
MVRGRDACWEHCVLVDAARQKRELTGRVYRMKFHLAQIRNKDIVPCAEVPDDLRDNIRSILSTPKRQKTPKKWKIDQLANVVDFHPDPGSSGQHGSTCPSLLLPRPSPSLQPPVVDVLKLKQDNADKRIAVFFFHNSIPLSAATSVYHQEMMDAVTECGHMFSHTEWLSSVYGQRRDAQAIKSLSYMERFWKSAREALSVPEPLRKGIEKEKAAIKAYYRGSEEKDILIWDIIDRRWNTQLHSPLHAAAAFLNPSISYSSTFKMDLRMRNGFQEAMMKMATEDKEKVEVTKEHPIYINAQGALGTDFAVMGRTLSAPVILPPFSWMIHGWTIHLLNA